MAWTTGSLKRPAPRKILGKVLKTRREEVVITSKVYSPVGNGPNDHGGSRYHIMREIERSLHRLGTDRIDVYLLHHFDPGTPIDEDASCAGRSRTAGQGAVCRVLQLRRVAGVQDAVDGRSHKRGPHNLHPEPVTVCWTAPSRARCSSLCATGDWE